MLVALLAKGDSRGMVVAQLGCGGGGEGEGVVPLASGNLERFIALRRSRGCRGVRCDLGLVACDARGFAKGVQVLVRRMALPTRQGCLQRAGNRFQNE